MVLRDQPNIREVMAFPKTQAARDEMMDAPAPSTRTNSKSCTSPSQAAKHAAQQTSDVELLEYADGKQLRGHGPLHRRYRGGVPARRSASLALVPAIDAILAARGTSELPEDSIASELSASCVELAHPSTALWQSSRPSCPPAPQATGPSSRGCGRGSRAGAHPFSKATAQQITGKSATER